MNTYDWCTLQSNTVKMVETKVRPAIWMDNVMLIWSVNRQIQFIYVLLTLKVQSCSRDSRHSTFTGLTKYTSCFVPIYCKKSTILNGPTNFLLVMAYSKDRCLRIDCIIRFELAPFIRILTNIRTPKETFNNCVWRLQYRQFQTISSIISFNPVHVWSNKITFLFPLQNLMMLVRSVFPVCIIKPRTILSLFCSPVYFIHLYIYI